MKIFISYSTKDYNKIKKIKHIIDENTSIKCTFLKPRCLNLFWRQRAKYYIRECDCVLYVVSDYSINSQFVSWEIETAKLLKKKIYGFFFNGEAGNMCKNNDMKDDSIDKVDNIADLNNKLLQLERNEFEETLFNMNEIFELKESTLFEQYKLMVGTSEELVKRRQVMNTFFLTLNLGILSAIGLVIKRIFNIVNNGDVAFLLLLSIVGAVSAYSWRKMITSFGQLNKGKFQVINALEKYLSVSIFNAEWIALGKGKDKNKYSSFTDVEKNVPGVFLIIYVLLCAFIIFCNVHMF